MSVTLKRPSALRRALLPRAFAFDLDETLVDANAHHGRATRALLESRGVDASRLRDRVGLTTGARTRDVMSALARASALTESVDVLLAERHRAFAAALAADPPSALPGAVEAVRAFREIGPVALVTSGYGEDVRATIEAIGLANAFDATVTGDDVERPKPDPQAYALAAQALSVAPHELLAFEDSVRGVESALRAGARVVAIPHAPSTRRDDVQGADVVLASLQEALPARAFLARLRPREP